MKFALTCKNDFTINKVTESVAKRNKMLVTRPSIIYGERNQRKDRKIGKAEIKQKVLEYLRRG